MGAIIELSSSVKAVAGSRMWVVHFTDKNGKATVLSAKAATRTPARRTQEHQPNAELRRGLLRIFGIADFWLAVL